MESPPKSSTPQPEQDFRASDVKEVADLSYRQLHNWDSKGALPSQREAKEGWRRFTTREVFVLLVCKEIREKFGVPLESLGFVKSFMLQKEADHFRYALTMMKDYGLTVYLLTDFKETFILDNDLEFEDLFELAFFRGDDPAGYIFLKLNPLVNRLLKWRDLPELKTSNVVYDSLNVARTRERAGSQQELEVLRLIREKAYQRILVHLKGGKIVEIDVEEDLSKDELAKREKDIRELLNDKDYQTITVQRHDGRIVHISRKIPIKFK